MVADFIDNRDWERARKKSMVADIPGTNLMFREKVMSFGYDGSAKHLSVKVQNYQEHIDSYIITKTHAEDLLIQLKALLGK